MEHGNISEADATGIQYELAPIMPRWRATCDNTALLTALVDPTRSQITHSPLKSQSF